MTRSAEYGAVVVTAVVILGLAGALFAADGSPLSGLRSGMDLMGLVGIGDSSGASSHSAAAASLPGEVARVQQRSRPPVQSHAYNAVSVLEAGLEVELPLWRNRHTAARHTTAIAVMNVGGKDADVTITFRDASGQAITDCDADCTATIAPSSGVYWWPPELKGVGERTDMSGSATIESTEPVAAVVVDMSQTGRDDMASYGGIGLESEYPSSSQNLHPQLLKDALEVGGETGGGSSMLQVLNVDQLLTADVITTLFPWGGGVPVDLSLKIGARESGVIALAVRPELADGPYSAIAVADQVVIGSLSRSNWAESGAAIMARESAAGSRSVVPLVFKNAGDRCSLVTIQNPSLRAEVEYEVEIYEPGGSKPVMTRAVLVNPGRGRLLDLCRGNEFADLADDFVGAMHVVAPDQALVASHSLVDVVSVPGPAAAAGMPAAFASDNLFAPVINSGWPPDRDNADMPDLSSLIAVNNPGSEPVEVVVKYAGIRGGCAGEAFEHDPRTIPPRTSELFDPGPDANDVLPTRCVAAARIEATGGDVLASVYDQGYPKQPTPTPTQPPTDTPTTVPTATATITATATATLTPTLVASPTASATDRPSLTPTSTPTAQATTAEATRRATATSTPPPPTAPRETPLPQPTRVPERDWTRVDRTNSLLPYDNVRYLEIDQEGGTWMRLIKPAGGPDAIVYVEPTGKWRIYDAGIKAVVERLPRDFLLGLRALRDFFDVDGRGRLWVGPEVNDGSGWDAVAGDVGSPAGGVRYDDRTLVDRAQRAWVPYSTQLDCVPPQICLADGLRAFGFDGDIAEDVTIRPSSGGSGYGVPDAQLITRRGRVPGGVVASASDAAARPAQRNAPGGSTGLTGVASDAVGHGRAPDSPEQATGDTEWIVTASEYFVLPDSGASFYPFLDPSDWLSTGLRNAGFASAATVSPSGQLQVVTWLERDTGSTVQYQILLNTLADTGWLVEDLTGKGPLGADVEFESVVGMDYCPDGALWLATASGAIGVRADGDRPDGSWTVYPEDSGVLEEGEIVSDIGCGPGGAVWIGTQHGLLGYGFEIPPVQIYVPSAEQTK